MFEKLEQCPICGSTEFTNRYIIKDHSISKEDFALVSCDNCSFLFTNPRPVENQLSKYYSSEDYISHQNKATNPINWIYRIARHFTLNWKRNIISRYQKHGAALDIGCGTGHFLSKIAGAKWSVVGIEPDNTAKSIAASQLPKGLFLDSLYELPIEQKFDLITLWHVLEHVPHLNEYLNKIKKHLKPTGTLIIAVPNHNSYDARHYREHWAGYDVPRHLYHFSQDTMTLLLKKHQLKLSDTIPMKLDAYYVSLLSEKYLSKGLKGYTDSIITAYKSNSYAIANNNEFSSLIFVARP